LDNVLNGSSVSQMANTNNMNANSFIDKESYTDKVNRLINNTRGNAETDNMEKEFKKSLNKRATTPIVSRENISKKEFGNYNDNDNYSNDDGE